MTDERLLSVREVADRLNTPERTIAYLAQQGELPASKVGRAWRFRQADVDAYLQRQRNQEDEAV